MAFIVIMMVSFWGHHCRELTIKLLGSCRHTHGAEQSNLGEKKSCCRIWSYQFVYLLLTSLRLVILQISKGSARLSLHWVIFVFSMLCNVVSVCKYMVITTCIYKSGRKFDKTLMVVKSLWNTPTSPSGKLSWKLHLSFRPRDESKRACAGEENE